MSELYRLGYNTGFSGAIANPKLANRTEYISGYRQGGRDRAAENRILSEHMKKYHNTPEGEFPDFGGKVKYER